MTFEPHRWVVEGSRLQGVLLSDRGREVEACQVPLGDSGIDGAMARAMAAARLESSHPNLRLPQCLGVARGQDAVLLLTKPVGGLSLRELAPLPGGAVMGVLAELLGFATSWRGMVDDTAVACLSGGVFDAGHVNLRPRGGLMLARPDLLQPDGTFDPGLTAVVRSLGELGWELVVGHEQASQLWEELRGLEAAEHASRLRRAYREVPAGTSRPMVQAILSMLAFNPRRRPGARSLAKWAAETRSSGALRRLAEQRLGGLVVEGPPHPWRGRLLPVEVVPRAPPITLDGATEGDATEGESGGPTSPPPRAPMEAEGRTAERKYRILEAVGQGGMGHVLEVYDPRLRRRVALKVLKAHARKNAKLVDRFTREVQITAQLQHPNVPPVHTMERTESGAPAFSMKMIEGVTFKAYIEDCRRQEEAGEVDEAHELATRLEHFVRVCDAVSYAHSKRVIHRDLKPSNLMVGTHNEVYVMDWGVARLAGGLDALDDAVNIPENLDDTGQFTRVGEVIGTWSYMSPEQAAGEHSGLTPASDQFALGLILYELVSLKRARPTAEQGVARRRAELGTFEPMVDCKGGPLPADLRAILQRAAHPEISRRYRSVAALGEDVRHLLRGAELDARPDDALRKMWRRVRQRPVLTMAVLMGVLLSAASVSVLSLVSALAAQRAATEQVRRVTSILEGVSQKGTEFDDRMQLYEQLLEGVTSTYVRMLQDRADQGHRFPAPADLGADYPGAEPLDRYGQYITFDTPISALAPATALEPAAQQVGRLRGIGPLLRRVMLRTLDTDPSLLDDDDIHRMLYDEGAPLLYVVAGFETGLLVSYPGHSKLGEGYDPRQRPWYMRARIGREATWGSPHPDSAGAGLLMAVSAPMRSDDGTVIGVAGLELALSAVIERMGDLDMPGLLATWVLDERGRVVIDPAAEGEPVVEHGALVAPSFDIPEVVAEVIAGPEVGYVRVGSDLYAFDRMETLGWYYLVKLDGRQAL